MHIVGKYLNQLSMRTILNILFLFFLFVECSKNVDPIENGKKPPMVEEDPVLILSNSGWDIFKATMVGHYRYGPSIIINDDESIDVWFAALGQEFGENISLTTGEGEQTFVHIDNTVTVGQKFTADVPFWSINVSCTNQGGMPSGLTLCLYRWDTDYLTTIKSPQVAQFTWFDYADNDFLDLTRSSGKFPAGTYLWIIKDGTTEYTGVWAYTGNTEGVTNYYNGTISSKSYKARYTLEKTNRTIYWDQISHQHSTNGGKQWSKEEMVLQPTEFSRDAISTCDPGVGKWGGYYYLGYTSVDDESGTENDVYVCRSKKSSGPWEKWNGSGWGGDPQPVIEYTPGTGTSSVVFGAGEPCFVVVNDVIFFYYTWNGTGTEATTTRVSTGDATDVNWPGNLTHHGTAINKSNIQHSDHCDVKYDEISKKFLAIHIASRMEENGYLVLWESDDGITFSKVGELRSKLMPYLHNCGWSGDEKGHIREGVQQYLSYAYGLTWIWGQWSTRWVPIELNRSLLRTNK